MKKLIFCLVLLCLCLTACGREDTLIYGSEEYTRINPAMDERKEIDLLLFDGLTDHDGDNQIVPRLAEKWDYDAQSLTYTFYLVEGVKWHDGKPFTAEDVKFTFEAIMDEENRSFHAPDFEDIADIAVLDKHTISIRLSAVNAAFLDCMTMPILPKHCLEGEDWQSSKFFLAPVGTGPYIFDEWEKGKSITLERNEAYFAGPAKIEEIVFKFVPDAYVRSMQLLSGDLDMASIKTEEALRLEQEGLALYRMETATYYGILYNFRNPYWKNNGDLIRALNYAIDRNAMLETVLRGCGETAYSPLQRNAYNYEGVEHYDYDPIKAQALLGELGCELDGQGYWSRNGHRITFVINAEPGNPVQLKLAQMAATQLSGIGLDVRADAPTEGLDWYGQQCCIIEQGSPFDADNHTYQVFATYKGRNVSGYSNDQVDMALTQARQTFSESERSAAYAQFQTALAETPAYTFLCYGDVIYGAAPALEGISSDLLLGHNGVGIFWNVCEWTKGQ